jgi:hypothetical protein
MYFKSKGDSKMKMTRVMLALVAFAAAGQVQAGLLELRGGVGLNAANPHSLEDRVNAVNGENLDVKNFDNYNADIFVNLPVIPIGIGLRQEWIRQKQSSGGDSLDLNAKNLSVLVDWRILNNIVYLGPIVSIGYPSANVDFHSSSSGDTSDKVTSGRPSYSVGAEAGVKLGFLLVGAEAGYSAVKLNNHSSDNPNVKADVDLSGAYGKLMVGVSLF